MQNINRVLKVISFSMVALSSTLLSSEVDFNSDGRADILNRTGSSNSLFLMNEDGSYYIQNIGNLTTRYKVVGVDDYNGDGVSDIFWRSGYKNYIWYMNTDGTHRYKNIGSLRTSYSVVGTGDYNGDGISDIFWRSGYKNYIWYMDKNGRHSYKNIGNVRTAYNVVGTGDFNGDGISDILWKKGTNNYLWYMKENGKHSYKKLKSSSHTFDEIGDYNGDGISDILWQTKEGGVLWLMQENGTFSSIIIEGKSIHENVDNTQFIAKAKKEPYFKYAWHIDSSSSILNSKGFSINKSADINVTEAWKNSMGKDVIIAVIDDGAEVEHEDLKSNILLAYNADDGSNNVDTNSENGSHGNTCAGFIVAPINGKGVVGIAPNAKVIVIRQESENDADVIKAFEYAKNNGAKVISCSWGTSDVSEAVVSELKKIYDAGITVLFASGNDGVSLDEDNSDGHEVNDESEVEWVIGVGSTGENNDVTTYSNYGMNIDVIAPGGDTELSSGILGLDNMGEIGHSNQHGLVNLNYSFTDGTSFATPVTAGVVALMYGVNPNITPAQIKEILIKTADKIGQDIDADYSDNNFDIKRAYGKVNAGKAVVEAKALIK